MFAADMHTGAQEVMWKEGRGKERRWGAFHLYDPRTLEATVNHDDSKGNLKSLR